MKDVKLVSIKLQPKQYNYAKKKAKGLGISLSAYLRNIVIEELKEKGYLKEL